MALYLGTRKVKIILHDRTYLLNLVTNPPTESVGWLLSSDGFILVDSTGAYLAFKEDD